MNYRHAFHAGNHADVLKHAALANLLVYLRVKPKPFFILDTHAGCGVYDLTSSEALRSGEFRHGIARIIDSDLAALSPYRAAVNGLNGPGAPNNLYPGSPIIIAAALRQGDRLIACELNPREAIALGEATRSYRGVRVERSDGYKALKALLPPSERRGLVLIDPPFEQPDEFTVLAASLAAAWRRWPTGLYLVWYPLKDRQAVDRFLAAIALSGIKDVTRYELLVRATEQAGGLAGSGLLAINASYALDAPMAEALPFLARQLAQGPGAGFTMDRLTAE